MRFLIRTATLLLQTIVFFALVTLLSYATTYFTAERYVEGSTPSRLFPLVAVQPAATPAAASEYELLRWLQFARKDPPPPPRNLRLPVMQGEFTAPVTGGYEPYVRFIATDLADGRQRVEVRVTDDGYVLYSGYVTDGAAVTPEYFRLWGPSSALFAVFPAAVLTFVLWRLFMRWRRRSATAPPVQ